MREAARLQQLPDKAEEVMETLIAKLKETIWETNMQKLTRRLMRFPRVRVAGVGGSNAPFDRNVPTVLTISQMMHLFALLVVLIGVQ